VGDSAMTWDGPSFEFATAGRIVFGGGRAAELGTITAAFGSRALVCTGSRPDRHGSLLSALPPSSVFEVSGEPTVAMARDAVAAARKHRADVVVGIGGGSVVDLGKAVAMLMGNGGDPLDYIEIIGRGEPITKPSLPFVAVPTTAGTGAEVTENAVLASPEHGRKASLRSPTMLPRTALVDPLLTLSCPPGVTAASGLDALTQCLEPLVSVQATPMTDGLAREGLSRAATGLRCAYLDGSDVAARTDMSLCSLAGGIALANAKLGAVHGFAAPVGGMVSAAHGAICAALLAPVLETNVRALRSREPGSRALDRYEEAARLLTGRPDASIDDGVTWIRETVELLEVPALGALGVRPEQVDEVVAKARTASSMKGNPVALTDEELHAILLAAMG
jgi:alcohol dehydrogenase class IV